MSDDISGGFLQSQRCLIQRNTSPNGQFFSNTQINNSLKILIIRIRVFCSFHSFSLPKDETFDSKEDMQQMILITKNSLRPQSLIQLKQRFLRLFTNILHPSQYFQTIIQDSYLSIQIKELRM